MLTRTVMAAFVCASLFLLDHCPPKTPAPSLTWTGPKTYVPPGLVVTVSGLGINGPVDQLPAGTGAITVARPLSNPGQSSVAAGYIVEDKVEQLTFVASGASSAFTTGATVADVKMTGPTLAPGASALITFGPIALPGCGFYRETLIAPGSRSVHYFAVTSSMSIAMISAPLGNQPVELFHDVRNVVAFTVTFTPGPGTTFDVFGPMTHPVVGSEGSTGTLAPAPVSGKMASAVSAPLIITYSITGRTHNFRPCTDIVRERLVESVNSLVSAITTDRCVLQQAALPVNVLHPCR